MTEKQIQHLLYETNKNIFLTGPGGTGKTTYIKEYIERNPKTIVCAPTGVAAAFIGGDTMHKVFNIPVPSLGATTNKITPSKLKELILADTVIIDEISMCRVDNFAFAMKVIKKAEKQRGKKIRIIVSGDFFQLPPVVPKEDEKLLRKFGFEKNGLPFTCKEWSACNFTVIELLEVKRQNDKEFVENLHRARIADKKCIPYFNQFIKEANEIPEDCIRICGTNAEAERINNTYLDELEGMPYAYKSRRTGAVYKMVTDDILLLKNGASVLFTMNDNVHGMYSNGTFGEVVKCSPDSVDVMVDHQLVTVKYQKIPLYTYKTKGNSLTKTEVGAVYQIPLKLARAITIHKSQGKTFDREVFTPKIFAPGQLYVSLSRVRSPEGLFITEPIIDDYLMTDPNVKKFYRNGYKWEIKKPVAKKTNVSRPAPKKKTAVSTKKRTASSKPTKRTAPNTVKTPKKTTRRTK